MDALRLEAIAWPRNQTRTDSMGFNLDTPIEIAHRPSATNLFMTSIPFTVRTVHHFWPSLVRMLSSFGLGSRYP